MNAKCQVGRFEMFVPEVRTSMGTGGHDVWYGVSFHEMDS